MITEDENDLIIEHETEQEKEDRLVKAGGNGFPIGPVSVLLSAFAEERP